MAGRRAVDGENGVRLAQTLGPGRHWGQLMDFTAGIEAIDARLSR